MCNTSCSHFCMHDALMRPPQRALLADTKSFVLDSGSSRHLDPSVMVLDWENLVSVVGFNNAETTTEGNGHLPLTLDDLNSGASVKLDMEDAGRMPSVACPIASLGKLPRLGYSFHFSLSGQRPGLIHGVSRRDTQVQR